MKNIPFLEHYQNYPNVASIFLAAVSGGDMIYGHVVGSGCQRRGSLLRKYFRLYGADIVSVCNASTPFECKLRKAGQPIKGKGKVFPSTGLGGP
jgi:hypothetical protein